MIITIAGTAGSGKTTIAKRLASELGFKRYYMGSIMRDIARKRGITLNELDELRKTDPSVDKEVDDFLVKIGKEEDNLVVESRTAVHFIPDSIKICLMVSPRIGAERIRNEMIEKGGEERNEQMGKSIEEQTELIKKRTESEREIYKKYYGFDMLDQKMYDFCIDTSNLKIEQVRDEVLDFIKSKT